MILHGDASSIPLSSDSVQAIITSPPYANMRKKQYGGIPAHKYVHWFKPIAKELLRVLKPRGSFILNIKENANDGEMSTYVLELILSMREWGWLWKEEYIWHKLDGYPSAHPDRFPNRWERLLHFTKQKSIDFYKNSVLVKRDSVMVKMTNRAWSGKQPKNGNWWNKNDENNFMLGKTHRQPSNVLEVGTSGATKNSTFHPATFPSRVPVFFINLFSLEGDLILDPFAGSGTTVQVAEKMARVGVGLDTNADYVYAANKLMPQQRLL